MKRLKTKGKAQRKHPLSNLARQVGDPVANLSVARNSLSPESFNDLIALVRSNPSISKKVFNPPFPRTVRALKNLVKVPTATNVEREILWAKTYLLPYIGGLAQFWEGANDFERALIHGDRPSCERALEKIESQYGVSLWLIKTRIAYLQFAVGAKARTEYAKRIIKGARKNGFVAFITHYFSQQNEATMTASSFSAMMQSRITKMRPTGAAVADYIEFHMFPNIDIDSKQIANILRVESTGAVIDYYETLLRLSRIVISKGNSDLQPIFESCLERLSEACVDNRLQMLMFELRDESTSQNNAIFLSSPHAVEAANFFLRGRYTEALSRAVKALESSEVNFDCLEVAARALSLLPSEQTDSQLAVSPAIHAMRSLILAQSNAAEAAAYLSKLSLNFSGHSWADSLRGFIAREHSPLSPQNLPTERYAVSGVPIVSPLRLDSFSESLKRKYALLNRRMYGDQTSVLYAESLASGNFNTDLNRELSQDQRTLLNAETSIASKDSVGALTKANLLLKSSERYYQRKATRISLYCFLELGKLQECVDLLTTFYLEEGFDSAYPYKDATTRLIAQDDAELTGNISSPILLDIYSKYIGTDFESERRYAYEDFLFANGIQRPSELKSIVERFELSKLIYFLRNIAVESIMDDSVIVFTGSRDIADERVAVCRLLMQLDPNRSDDYQSEIREIIGRLMIRKRVREIQRSKIYVDAESIKKKIGRTMRERFNRYKALRGRDYNDIEVIDRNPDDTETVGSSELLELPTDEVAELLDSIVIDLRDLFLSSNEHGLDGYLSVRIRHGTLAGELRGPLETANLLTKRDSITGGHKLSANLQLKVSSTVLTALTRFTSDYDALINEIINEWIQVKRTDADKGMLDFTLTTRFTDILALEVTNQMSFEEFVEKLFGLFYELLNLRLKSLRLAIRTTAKNRAMVLLTRLIADLESQADNQEAQGLLRAVKTAQTELQRVFDRITEWFRMSTTTANEPFSIEDAINISRESVSTFTRGISTIVTVPAEPEIIIKGRLLNSFVDILSIIFENILRHSGLISRPEAVVNVTNDDSSIEIVIENEIGKGVATEDSRNHIADIRKAIDQDEYGKSISKEGGTGFHKIWKFLNHDFKPKEPGASPHLEFGFTQNDRFFVAFKVPISKEILL